MGAVTESPTSRKEREFERRKIEILEVAENLFAEQGYAATRMEDIAKHAEFSVGYLYKFFKNKEDLYGEMLRQKVGLIEPNVFRLIGEGTNPMEKLRGYFKARIQLYWDHPLFFRVYYRDLAGASGDTGEGLTPDVQGRYRKHLDLIESIIEEGIKEGVIIEMKPRLLTVLSEGVLRSYLGEVANKPENARNENEETAVCELFLNGIRK
jgi:AcrR family transcriptional regulator